MDILSDSEFWLAAALTGLWFYSLYRDSVRKSADRSTGDFVGGEWE